MSSNNSLSAFAPYFRLRSNGTAPATDDIWLGTNQDESYQDSTPIPAHIERIDALPDIDGIGRLRSLKDAMALDAVGRLDAPFYGSGRWETRTLEQLVDAFRQEADAESRNLLAAKIIARWAGAEDARPAHFSTFSGPAAALHPYISLTQMAVVEAVRDSQWSDGGGDRLPDAGPAGVLRASYEQVYEGVWASLMAQTHLATLYASIDISVSDTGNTSLDFSGVAQLLSDDTLENRQQFRDFVRSLLYFVKEDDLLADVQDSTSFDFADQFEYYKASIGGNDEMRGFAGADVYWMVRGMGHDTIREVGGVDDNDVIRLEEGLDASDVRLARSASNLYVQLLDDRGNVRDSYTIPDHFINAGGRISRVELSDGTLVYDAQKFKEAPFRKEAPHSDILDNSGDHFDTVLRKNDLLDGGTGSDVYWLRHGTGNDRIVGLGDSGGGDVIRLAEGLSAHNVRLDDYRNVFSVYLLDNNGWGTGNSYRVYQLDSLTNPERVLPRVELFNGTLVFNPQDYRSNAPIRGSDGHDHLQAIGSGTDHFNANTGGNDTLYGGIGSDVYWLGYGTGADKIIETRNSDVDVIRLEEGLTLDNVRLERDTKHLYVQLLDIRGGVTDSYTVVDYYTNPSRSIKKVEMYNSNYDPRYSTSESFDATSFEQLRIRDGEGNNHLYGVNYRWDHIISDHFDADAGGNDHLYGRTGSDVYWLGLDTDHDTIIEVLREGDENVIRLKDEVPEGYSVNLTRSTDHLYMHLVDKNDQATGNSYTVENYYTDANRRINDVELPNGTSLFINFSAEADKATYRGSDGDDHLRGLDGQIDYFYSDAGGYDSLYGGSGADVYWLGYGTGHDTIYEVGGAADGDVIRMREDVLYSNVRVERDDDNLYVWLLKDGVFTDSYTVMDYYTNEDREISRVEMANGRLVFAAGPWPTVPAPSRLQEQRHFLDYGTGEVTLNEVENVIILGDESLTREHVRLTRSGDNLHVELLKLEDGEMNVTGNSYTVVSHFSSAADRLLHVESFNGRKLLRSKHFDKARIHGSTEDDHLLGLDDHADHFDADAGGDDDLHGGTGSDVYWLGLGTGHDTIHEVGVESDENVIRLEKGMKVELSRSLYDLHVHLLDNDGEATGDIYTVKNYYGDGVRPIQDVLKSNGKPFFTKSEDKSSNFADEAVKARIRGDGTDGEHIHGLNDHIDHFDVAGEGDHLHGRTGSDVYWLGLDTGSDTIHEIGHEGDENVIRLKEELKDGKLDVRLSRSELDLYVDLVNQEGKSTDNRYAVENYYGDEVRRINGVVKLDGTSFFTNFVNQAEEARIRGDIADGERLFGLDNNRDHFDADAGGNDNLFGRTGSDVYWLGEGTGYDRIIDTGGAADIIKLEDEYELEHIGEIEIVKRHGDLLVTIVNSEGSNSLTVSGHFDGAENRIEHIEVRGKVLDTSQVEDYIIAWNDISNNVEDREYDTMQSLVDDFWF